MKCPACGNEWKLPGQQAGGRKGGKKGFAVKPLSAEARKRAWKTRKARATRSPNAEGHGRGTPRTVQPLVGSLDGDK
jgi:hypothetical protein